MPIRHAQAFKNPLNDIFFRVKVTFWRLALLLLDEPRQALNVWILNILHRNGLRVGDRIFQNAQQQAACRVETVPHIIAFQTGKDAQRLPVAFKAAILPHAVVQGGLAAMPKRRMPQIMRKAYGAHEMRARQQAADGVAGRRSGNVSLSKDLLPFLEAKTHMIGNGGSNLCDFHGMCQARPIKIAVAQAKDLRLSLKSPKGRAVHQPGKIPLIFTAMLIFTPHIRRTPFLPDADIINRHHRVPHIVCVV